MYFCLYPELLSLRLDDSNMIGMGNINHFIENIYNTIVGSYY